MYRFNQVRKSRLCYIVFVVFILLIACYFVLIGNTVFASDLNSEATDEEIFVNDSNNLSETISETSNFDAPANFTTVFDANGGAWSSGAQTISIIEDDTYYKLPDEDPMYTLHGFLGWYTDPIAGSKITSKTKTTKDYNILYAHWEKYVNFKVEGGLGHWTFVRKYTDKDFVFHEDTIYSIDEYFPVNSSFMVQPADNKIFIQNILSPTKPFMYYIEVFGLGALDLSKWTINGQTMTPGDIYYIGEDDEQISVKANYNIGENAIPMSINASQGISDFVWETFFNGQAVASGSIFPFKDMMVVGIKFMIEEDGCLNIRYISDSTNSANEANIFSGTIQPLLLDGYKIDSVSLEDGPVLEFNKEYSVDTKIENLNFVINCSDINQPNQPKISEAAQTGDASTPLIIALCLVFALASVSVLRRKVSR